MFLKLLIGYLKDGANCVHFMKQSWKSCSGTYSFIILKRNKFPFPSYIGEWAWIQKKVLDNYRNARTVKELARLCGSSLSTFNRKFLKEFREPASEWLQKQINTIIKYKLADEDIPIGNIADELHFLHMPNFVDTVKELRIYSRRMEKTTENSDKTPERLSGRM